MRRALTLAIVMLFWLAPLSALIPGADQAALPACCRRHGAHHCAMTTAALHALNGSPGFAAPDHCPYYTVQVRAITPALVLPSVALSHGDTELRFVPALTGHIPANSAHTHAGRGPPQIG